MTIESDVDHHSGGKGRLRSETGPRAAALAARQHGVVARRQLLRLGVSPRQIDRLTASGVLHPIHRGVYAVGHPRLTLEGRWMAGVLAGGPGAVLSHHSAAMHWRLLAASSYLPQITTPSRRRRRRGIDLHTASLPRDETTIRSGIPVTTVARTLLDLASCLDARRLERALAEAEYRRYADHPSLPELIERHRGRRGVRAILASGNAELGPTRSALERRFLRFLDSRGLERPELNAPLELGGRFIAVDCMWRSQRVVVELDGRAAHLRAGQWESDRLRDRRLLATNWTPARVTSQQLSDDPDGLESDLRALGIGDRCRGDRRRRRD